MTVYEHLQKNLSHHLFLSFYDSRVHPNLLMNIKSSETTMHDSLQGKLISHKFSVQNLVLALDLQVNCQFVSYSDPKLDHTPCWLYVSILSTRLCLSKSGERRTNGRDSISCWYTSMIVDRLPVFSTIS